MESSTIFLGNIININSYFENALKYIESFLVKTTSRHVLLSQEIFYYNSVKTHFQDVLCHLELLIKNFKQILRQHHKRREHENEKYSIIDNFHNSLNQLQLNFTNNAYNRSSLEKIEKQAQNLKSNVSEDKKEIDMYLDKNNVRVKPCVFRSRSCASESNRISTQLIEKRNLTDFREKVDRTNSISCSINNGVDSRTEMENHSKLLKNSFEVVPKFSIRSYPMKYLNEWEKLWEKNTSPPVTIKRSYSENKAENKKLGCMVSARVKQFEQKTQSVSSTYPDFLDVFANNQDRKSRLRIEYKDQNDFSSLDYVRNTKDELWDEVKERGYSSDTELNGTVNDKVVCSNSTLGSRWNVCEKDGESEISSNFHYKTLSRSKSEHLPRIVEVIYKKKTK